MAYRLVGVHIQLTLDNTHNISDVVSNYGQIERPKYLQNIDNRCREKGKANGDSHTTCGSRQQVKSDQFPWPVQQFRILRNS